MPNQFERDNPPRYLQIALDFARKIVDKQYEVGEKVFARSALASQYNVSSETARRAMCVLEDMEIVVAEKGSGSKIVSQEKAIAFLNEYQSIRSLEDIRQDILQDLQKLEELSQKIKSQMETMVDKTDRFRDVGPFVPYHITLPNPSALEGKTLLDIHFWQHTKATVIALKHQDTLQFSPGPHAPLHAGDTLYFVGDSQCYSRVEAFLLQKQAQ